MKKKKPLKISLTSVPEILVAGVFQHEDKAFLRKYQTRDASCIHLYGYPGTIKIDDMIFSFEEGDMSVIPPFSEYRYDLPSAGLHYCIHFRSEEAGNVKNKLHLPFLVKLGKGMAYEKIRAKIREITQFYSRKQNDPRASVAAGITLLQMFCHISLMKDTDEELVISSASAAVSKAASIIDENLHLPINVPEIAGKAGLSQNYLARLFKKRYGVTLTRYHALKRMELARYLLLNSDMKIKEIGARCGLPDPQHFNKLFRRFSGKSPSATRNGR